MSTRLVIFIIGILILISIGLALGFIGHPKTEQVVKLEDTSKPAYYEQGETTIVKSFDVGTSGGVFEIKNTGTPVDGVVIEIPAGALLYKQVQKITLSVGYNGGVLHNVKSGKASGIVLVLSTDSIVDYEFPVRVKVPFVPDPSLDPGTPVPYAIDREGHLFPLQLISVKREIGEFTFDTSYTPLMFTWIYANLR